MNGQLELSQLSPPAAEVTTSSVRGAGGGSSPHSEGIAETPSHHVTRHPRQADPSLSAPGEDLTPAAPRWLADFWAMNWERRGIRVKLAKRGRMWAVVER